jgi:hypothetical protein
MIVAGTYPPINIDLGKDELGMTLQREYRESGYRVWHNFKVNGKLVKSSVDIGELPPGRYRLLD